MFWPLPNTTFVEGSLHMDTFRLCYVVWKDQLALSHNATSHFIQYFISFNILKKEHPSAMKLIFKGYCT